MNTGSLSDESGCRNCPNTARTSSAATVSPEANDRPSPAIPVPNQRPAGSPRATAFA
ncbi:hypothetical protein Ae706Ps2_6705 [Pseudonocardia sp. Ae706_Ps2]|nr:hypothetical protein Ae706Ps2_6705 [Pseudonocardia sp. Ae706_Ps2]